MEPKKRQHPRKERAASTLLTEDEITILIGLVISSRGARARAMGVLPAASDEEMKAFTRRQEALERLQARLEKERAFLRSE